MSEHMQKKATKKYGKIWTTSSFEMSVFITLGHNLAPYRIHREKIPFRVRLLLLRYKKALFHFFSCLAPASHVRFLCWRRFFFRSFSMDLEIWSVFTRKLRLYMLSKYVRKTVECSMVELCRKGNEANINITHWQTNFNVDLNFMFLSRNYERCYVYFKNWDRLYDMWPVTISMGNMK